MEDRHGRIWFRTLSGQLAWWKNDTIHTIGANSKILAEQQKNFTLNMCLDKGDTIWCGLSSVTGYYYKIAPPYKAENMKVINYETSTPTGTCVHWVDRDSNYIVNRFGKMGSPFMLSFFRSETLDRR